MPLFPPQAGRAPTLRIHRFFWAAALSLATAHGAAQNTALAEHAELIKAPHAASRIGADLFGDAVNLYQGRVTFTHTDVSLRGNNALPVQVGRRLAPGVPLYTNSAGKAFLNWSLDMPYMYGTYSDAEGWTVWPAGGANKFARCSQFGEPSSVYSGAPWDGTEFWKGSFMAIPGHGEQQMLRRDPAFTKAPNGDPGSYPVVTSSHWAIGCVPRLANDPDGTQGQGFLAVSPDGVKYQFDHMVSVPMHSISKAKDAAATVPTEGSAPPEIQPGNPTPNASTTANLARKEVRLLATLVTDRYGNWVRYHYDPARPANLTSIVSSDGRRLNLNYGDLGTPHLVTSVHDGERTWTYHYGAAVNGIRALVGLTLPDGSSWDFSGLPPLDKALSPSTHPTCGGTNATTGEVISGTMKHPSGAIATFNLTATSHGRSDVPMQCQLTPNGSISPGIPIHINTFSLTSKSIEGPGLPATLWRYEYGPANASFAPCTGSCPTSKTVTVTDPAGHATRYTFGNRFQLSEGRIEQVDIGWDGSDALSTTFTRYRAPGAGPYPTSFGQGGEGLGDGEALSRPMPVEQRVTIQQGVEFSWTANAFDTSARATNVKRASSLGMRRTETTVYHDNLARWVLGQVHTVTEDSTGKVIARNGYDGATAALETVARFGRVERTMRYHPDGTLAAQADGLGQATAYSDYKNGVPRLVRYANGSSGSALVDHTGNVTSTTDANGFTSSYTYDAMGRLKGMYQPSGDTVAWKPTTIAFYQSATPHHELPAGHWREEIRTGNAYTVNYHDALWRPMYTEKWDNANLAGTMRIVRHRYDHQGRTTFTSYPRRGYDQLGPGMHHQFDALGRQVRHVTESEQGNLTILTEFGAPFTKTVTDARGHATVYGYQAFDQPVEDAIASIAAPEDVHVVIARDVLGKPTSVTRSGGGKSATRSYVYDDHERLCKTIEPETAATIIEYDGANNVRWRASGQAFPSTTSCSRGAIAAQSKISFAYDTLNRLTDTTFGDGSPAIHRSYTPDGLPATIRSNGSEWTNSYNKRRLNERERLTYGGRTYDIARSYDANGSLSQLRYPDSNFVLDYAPNALGEAQRVGSYATSITYHPNGAVRSFTYGNGVTHTTAQNARGLPEMSIDSGVLHDTYAYDQNANVTAITDGQQGTASRTMGYDGLNRLRIAGASRLWGNARYSYDALDNLTGVRIEGGATARSTVHTFDAANRLSSISGGPPGYNFSYRYDGQGNIVRRGAQEYEFDLGNRMKSAKGKATYGYDGLGHRYTVVGADGVNRLQLYSQGGQLLYVAPTGQAGTRYVYLNRHVIAEVSNAGTVYNHTDALGSPVAQTSSTRAMLGRTHYEPYGYVASGVTHELGFTGHVNDRATGLVYMQQRYYDPFAGRMLSIDPVTTDANSGSSFNRYVYANNNPYKFVDPDGRAVETPWDAANVAMGVVSLARNVAMGNHIGAAVDAVGIALDGAATATPFVPGGAATAIQASRAASTLAANAKIGAAFQSKVAADVAAKNVDTAQEITIKTASGVKTRMDVVARDATGSIKCTECKGSSTAPLTANQKVAHPEIQQSGGVVVGAGKPGFAGGTIIPPHKVDVVRP